MEPLSSKENWKAQWIGSCLWFPLEVFRLKGTRMLHTIGLGQLSHYLGQAFQCLADSLTCRL
jgi:hypothetical protein